MVSNPYDENLAKNPANYQPLTPLSFLSRTALAVTQSHGDHSRQRAHILCRILRPQPAARLRTGLRRHRSGRYRLGHARQFAANARSTLRRRDDRRRAAHDQHASRSGVIAFQLDHADTKLLITDREFSDDDEGRAGACESEADRHRLQRSGISADRRTAIVGQTTKPSSPTGDPDFDWRWPEDEWEAISLNYTSGTTGNPKGVVYHHRGAALMCYANTISTGMTRFPVYLWTLPMFHCNGWCFPWSVTLAAGTHVCLRWVRAKAMYDAIVDHKVTHLSGAPIVMATLLNASEDEKRPISHVVAFNHAAAPPPAAVIAAMTDAGFQPDASLRSDRNLRSRDDQRMGRVMGRSSRRRAQRQTNSSGYSLRGARGPDRDGARDR